MVVVLVVVLVGVVVEVAVTFCRAWGQLAGEDDTAAFLLLREVLGNNGVVGLNVADESVQEALGL